MPFMIRTLENAEIRTGFIEGDLHQVHIAEHEIPPLSVPQFLDFAVSALGRIIPEIDPEERSQWTQRIDKIDSAVSQLTDRPSGYDYYGMSHQAILDDYDTMRKKGNTEDRTVYYDALAASTRLDQAEFRHESPFEIEEGGKVVGIKKGDRVIYRMDYWHLFNLTSRVINGGINGWGEAGTFEEVRVASRKLSGILHGAVET